MDASSWTTRFDRKLVVQGYSTWYTCKMAMGNQQLIISRYPGLLYTDEGKKTMERLWEETLEELQFAGVGHIVTSMKSK